MIRSLRALWVLSIVFWCAALGACAPQGAVNKLKAALARLQQTDLSVDPLSTLQPEEIRNAEALCSALRDLDPERYEAICVNPGLTSYLARLSLQKAAGTAGGPAGPGPSPQPSVGSPSPTLPTPEVRSSSSNKNAFVEGTFESLSVGQKQKYAKAIVARLQAVGQQVGDAATRGAWSALTASLAHAEVIREDLVASLPEDVHRIVPESPMKLLPAEVVGKVIAELDARLLEMELAATLTNRVEYKETVETLRTHRQEIANLLADHEHDWVAKNQSKLAKALDTARWDSLAPTAEARAVELATSRMEQARLTMPGLLLTASGSNGPRGPPALVAITEFWNEPAAFVSADAQMRVEFEKKFPKRSLAKEYPHFLVSQLSDADLALAMQYSYQQQHDQGGPGPDRRSAFAERARQSDLLVLMKSEASRRPSSDPSSPNKPPRGPPPGGAAGETPTPTDSPPPTRPGSGGATVAVPVTPRERYHWLGSYASRFPPGEAQAPKGLIEGRNLILKDGYLADEAKLDMAYRRLSAAEAEVLDRLPQSMNASLREPWKRAREGLARAASLLEARREHLARVFDVRLDDPYEGLRKTLMRVAYNSSGQPPNVNPAAALVDSAFQRALADAQEELTKLTADALKNADSFSGLAAAAKTQRPARTALQINQQPGARLADELKLASGNIDSASLTRLSEPRLPLTMKNRNWSTFTASTSSNTTKAQIYDFESDVKNAKTFNGVGGGIHMGGKLVATGDYSRSMIRYDAQTQKLLLLDFGGSTEKPAITVLAEIDPQSMKALYRYAASGHNLGVSIGWTGDAVVRQAGNASPVLLDREFVDTRVGQDLILADQIPWRLYERKPAGWVGENGIADAFCAAHKNFRVEGKRAMRSEIEAISSWITTRRDLSSNGRKLAIERLSAEDRYNRAFEYALLKSQTVGEMVSVLEAMKSEEEIRRTFLPIITKGVDEQLAPHGDALRRFAARREAIEATMDAHATKVRDVLSGMIAGLKQEVPTITTLNMAFLFGEAEIAEKSEFGRESAEWTSGSLEQSLSPVRIQAAKSALKVDYAFETIPTDLEVLAAAVTAYFPDTGLAVMWDEDTALSKVESAGKLRNEMTYRYADTYRNVDLIGERILFHSEEDPKDKVRTLQALTDVANSTLRDGTLGRAYPPVQRVKTYAQIVALLRWAETVKNSGTLGDLDLSDLLWVSSFDTQRTPTPDRIRRSDSADRKRCS